MDINILDLILFLVYMSALWTISQVLTVLVRRYGENRWGKRDSKVRAKIIQYLFLLAGTSIGIYYLIGVDLEQAVAAAGIASIAIAFISKKVFENIIAGFQISAEKKVEIEDWVELSKHNWKGPAKITDISLTKTMLRDSDGTEYLVPNVDINDSQIINFSKTGYAEVDIELPLPLNTDIAELERDLLPLVRSYPDVFPNVKYESVLHTSGLTPKAIRALLQKNIDVTKLDPSISVQSIKEKYIVFTVRCYVAQVNRTTKVKSELTWLLWKELRQLGKTL